MREVPAVLDAIWAGGNYTGTQKPIVRVTIEHQDMKLYKTGAKVKGVDRTNLYASWIFGPQSRPLELNNVKSVTWTRGVDTDIATAQIDLYNTAPIALGQSLEQFRDLFGYYSFPRALTSLGQSRWGQTRNPLSEALIPDNVIRTYEGYGFDATKAPELDPNLVLTGVWRIMDVVLTAAGLITLKCEDMISILRDQICYHPVIPANFFPVQFSSTPARSGFKAGYQFTKVALSGGRYDKKYPPPAGWTGPTAGVPSYTTTTNGFECDLTWTAPAAPPTGYIISGYQVLVDNVRLPTVYGPAARAAKLTPANFPMQAGNVYLVQVAPVYERLSDGFQLLGDPRQALPEFHRPVTMTTYYISTQSVEVNSGTQAQVQAGTTVLGNISFGLNGPAGTYCEVIIAVRSLATEAQSISLENFRGYDPVQGHSTFYLNTGLLPVGYNTIALPGIMGQGLVNADVLVYPIIRATTEIKFGEKLSVHELSSFGAGAMFLGLGHWFGPPVYSALPHEPAAAGSNATVTANNITRPLAPTRVSATFLDSSNTYYTGTNGAIYGHTPSQACDGNLATYWLSVGNDSPNADFAYEWIEVAVPNVEIGSVQYTTKFANYGVYLSVYARGVWVHYRSNDIIPYNAQDPVSHNGGNIPFVAYQGEGTSEGPHSFTLLTPIPGATRVRLTLHNLQDSGLGVYPYRGAMSDIKVFSSNAGTVAYPEPIVNDTDPTVIQTYTVRVQPKEIPGAGSEPGYYEDYCVDTETEALSRRGWLRWDEVQPGDELLSMNPTTRLMEWTPVRDVYRKHRQRKMISLESQLHSSLTTPDHKWLLVDQAGEARWTTTEDMPTGMRLPLCGPVAAPEAAKYEDAFVELVAWFWTEGWVNGEHGNACIAQSEVANPVHTARIRATLTTLFGAAGRMLRGKGAMWNESRRGDGVVTFRLSKPVKDALLTVAPDKVVDTGFLASLTAAQRTLFVERSLDADGWRTTHGRVGLAQRDERRARAFEIACLLDGRAVRTRQDCGGMWSVNLLRAQFTWPQTAKREVVDYDGVVWCPTLEHHNWVARRHGTVYLTGNTDIVKLFCAWGGFYWPDNGVWQNSDGSTFTFNYGLQYGLPNVDPVLGGLDGGRVWGDFMQTGVAGIASLTPDLFTEKPLLDCITYVADIIGFNFFADELGSIIWRLPNIFSAGNYVTVLADDPARTSVVVTIDELHNLTDLTVTASSRNVRERYFISNLTGKIGALAQGFNPNPSGLRRVGGWTDQNFVSTAECQVMADFIALRALMTYKQDTCTIPGNPRIQVDDQVRIAERVTGENDLHYVSGNTMTWNAETGEYTYALTTQWLGNQPFSNWAFDPAYLSAELQGYLAAIGVLPGASTSVVTGALAGALTSGTPGQLSGNQPNGGTQTLNPAV